MKRWMSVLLTVVMVVALVMSMSPAAFADVVSTPAPVTKTPTVTIPVEMKLTGTKPNPAETYNIVIEAIGDDLGSPSIPMPDPSSISITGAGENSFSITYNRVGIYKYKIYQGMAENVNPKCHYDNTAYYVEVYVYNNEDYTGLLTLFNVYKYEKVDGSKVDGSIEIKPNEGDIVINPTGDEYAPGDTKVDGIVFTNKYWVAPANTPSTGDESNVVLYALASVLALAALSTGLVVLKRKKQ